MGRWIKKNSEPLSLLNFSSDDGLLVNVAEKCLAGERIIESIGSASHSVFVVNPLVYDERFLDTLVQARRRGIRIRLITELRKHDKKQGIKYPTRGFDLSDPVEIDKQFRAPRHLVQSGVLCRGLTNTAHAKILLVDRRLALISSVNANPNGLGGGDNPAIEAGIELQDKDFVSHLSGYLEQLWNRCPFKLQNIDRNINLIESGSSACDEWSNDERKDNSGLLWSIPGRDKSLRDRITELIRLAKKRVIIVTYTFYETDKISGLNIELQNALSRGVDVTVIVRSDVTLNPEEYPDPNTRDLIGQGMKFLGLPKLHAKGMVVDDHACALFTGNINPYSLEYDMDSAHVECGFYEAGKLRRLKIYAEWLKAVAKVAIYQYEC